MKANEFVKKFGWEYAKERMEYCKGARLVGMEIELARLVESYDLVELYGGIEKSRIKVQGNRLSYKKTAILWEAIDDVESCL